MPGSLEKASNDAAEKKSVAGAQALTMRDAIKAMGPQWQNALPKHVTVERFTRAALTALGTVNKLAQCTQQSVLAGLTQAAQLGLEVSDVRGQCYLIPRLIQGQMTATFQLGYRGMIDLAARSGIDVAAEEIHEFDDYDFSLGTNRFLRHKPPLLTPRGEAIAYYATGSFADGRTPAFNIMSRIEVEEHRDKFASQKSGGKITGPWVEHFDAMARKTVIRALLNYLPVSVELREAVKSDAVEATAVDVGQITHAVYDAPNDGLDAVVGELADASEITETTATAHQEELPNE